LIVDRDDSEKREWRKKKDSIRFYDLTASSYEELYGKEQEEKYDAALKSLGISCLGKVLDVGCGPAIFLRKIVNTSTLRVGLDISYQILVSARGTDTSLMHIIRADADFLPVRDEIFDSVFAFTLFQNMPNPRSTLHEMLRIVRTKGVIVLTFPKASGLSHGVRHWFMEGCIPFQEIETDVSSKDCVFVCYKP
jgi:ubiquinone/menaquinone biosynthesis C-methylase UbiE